jgi:type I restriction enzyme S subunit
MKLPESWRETTVGNVVIDLQPGFAQKPGEEDEGTTPQIRTHNVSPDGKITFEGIKHISASAKEAERYTLRKGDVIFNNTNSEEWVGKTAVFDQEGEYVFSNHMTRLRVQRELVIPEYLASYLHQLWAMGYSKTRAKRWVSQAGIETSAIVSFKIPLPTLPEQQRIVDILSMLNRLIDLHRESVQNWNSFQSTLFLSLFGNPGENPNGYQIYPLDDIVDCFSGGTPSREVAAYWSGNIPWVSPKDMKSQVISSAEEFISESALANSATRLIPTESVLIVTRSGILQSQLPIGISSCPIAINQDIKALVPKNGVNGVFLAGQLAVLAPFILAQVRQGATVHNLETSRLLKTKVIVPPINIQNRYADAFQSGYEIFLSVMEKWRSLERLRIYMTLMAFSGDLTASWRERNQDELIAAAIARDDLLRERGTKFIQPTAESKLKLTSQVDTDRPARHWLLGELSEFQRQVLAAFSKYCEQTGNPLLAEDPDVFASFCDDEQVAERLQAFGPALNNRIRRTLGQLAALGLIAKVTLPKQNLETSEREYLKAFRPLRPEESTRLADVENLRKALGEQEDPA